MTYAVCVPVAGVLGDSSESLTPTHLMHAVCGVSMRMRIAPRRASGASAGGRVPTALCSPAVRAEERCRHGSGQRQVARAVATERTYARRNRVESHAVKRCETANTPRANRVAARPRGRAVPCSPFACIRALVARR